MTAKRRYRRRRRARRFWERLGLGEYMRALAQELGGSHAERRAHAQKLVELEAAYTRRARQLGGDAGRFLNDLVRSAVVGCPVVGEPTLPPPRLVPTYIHFDLTDAGRIIKT